MIEPDLHQLLVFGFRGPFWKSEQASLGWMLRFVEIALSNLDFEIITDCQKVTDEIHAIYTILTLITNFDSKPKRKKKKKQKKTDNSTNCQNLFFYCFVSSGSVFV